MIKSLETLYFGSLNDGVCGLSKTKDNPMGIAIILILIDVCCNKFIEIAIQVMIHTSITSSKQFFMVTKNCICKNIKKTLQTQKLNSFTFSSIIVGISIIMVMQCINCIVNCIITLQVVFNTILAGFCWRFLNGMITSLERLYFGHGKIVYVVYLKLLIIQWLLQLCLV